MIQRMKKLTFLIFHKEYDSFLSELQKLGVVHIQRSSEPIDIDKGTLQVLEEQLKRVILVKDSYIKLLNVDPETLATGNLNGADQYVETAEDLAEALRTAQGNASKYTSEVEKLLPWGTFDKTIIEHLEDAGVKVNYHVASKKNFAKEFPEYIPNVVSEDEKHTYFVTFTQEGDVDNVGAQTVQLPAETLAEAQQLATNYAAEVESIWNQQQQEAQLHLADIIAYEKSLVNKISYQKAMLETGSAADGKVMVLEGWFPEEQEDEVDEFLKATDVYYDIREPNETDNVPVKFKNNRFAHMYERLTKMYGFPSYNEWDPTPIVAPFFTLFFAICMGDAGYGILITLYGLLDMSGKSKKVPILGEMLEGCGDMICSLGIATMIVGFFLGTFFGINIVEAGWIPADTVLGKILAFFQGNVPGTKYSIQMASAIVIGVFHICLAMVIKAALYTKKEGLSKHLSTWGWVILIIGGVITGVLALTGTLSQSATTIVLIVIGAVSALAIFFLNNVERFVKKPVAALIINPLAGLYDTYNMASGLMGDVLSYIRLYALCLAGGMLGGAFNMIGNMIWGDKTTWTCVFAILIYIVGHLFNLLMSAISAFVHPLRLNFVEYFKNSGYEGKGTGYKPFEMKQ